MDTEQEEENILTDDSNLVLMAYLECVRYKLGEAKRPTKSFPPISVEWSWQAQTPKSRKEKKIEIRKEEKWLNFRLPFRCFGDRHWRAEVKIADAKHFRVFRRSDKSGAGVVVMNTKCETERMLLSGIYGQAYQRRLCQCV